MLPNLPYSLCAVMLAAAALPAQITYVDAVAGGNTTLADGSAFVPVTATSGTDNLWAVRTFANGGTIFESHSTSTSNEDAPMLRTTISGLAPGVRYTIYAYFWGANTPTANWRGRATVSATQPAPQIQGYNTRHNNTSMFLPMTPLALGSFTGYQQTSLGLAFAASGSETDGHFANPVLIADGNRFLFEIPLGTHVPDANGDIFVYADDLQGNVTNDARTWFDGVGYEFAPLPYGNGCGSPVPQIGNVGEPIMTRDCTITLGGAPPHSLALLIVGFDATTWNNQPLPTSLGFLGFPGCELNVAPIATLAIVTDGNGAAAHTVNLSGLPVIDVYWQWGVLAGSTLHATQGLHTAFHR